MNFSKMYLKVFIITLIVTIISFIYSNYINQTKQTETEKTLFVKQTETLQAQDIIEQEMEIVTIKTISNLLNAYNTKDMTSVKTVDYRLTQNNNSAITQKYIESLLNCYKFRLHDVQIEDSSIYTISGFFTYSYLTSENRESSRTYAGTNFIIKKIDGKYMITYLESKNFLQEYGSEEEGIKLSRKHGKDTYGTENLLNLVFED